MSTEGDPNLIVPTNEFREKESKPRAFNFLELEDGEKSELRQRVETWNGIVRIFVHALDQVMSEENGARVHEIMGRIIGSEKDTPPVILFLEEQTVDAFLDHVNQGSHPVFNKIYVVPTLPLWPYPAVRGIDRPSDVDMIDNTTSSTKYVLYSMKKFVDALVDVDVKTIFVGGVRLVLHNGDVNECVGNLIKMIQGVSELEGSKIDAKVSLGTAPLNRNDLRGIRDDLV